MNGIILLVHAPLASAMLDCISHIYGNIPDNILPIDIHGDEPQGLVHNTINAWINHKKYDGYLILNDLYGASPFNIGKNFIDKYQLKQTNYNSINTAPSILMLTGLSLPMLMKSMCHQRLKLEDMAQKSLEGILQCSSIIKNQINTNINKDSISHKACKA